MRLHRNLIVGVASSVWTALVALIVLPYYIKLLGAEAYGLIGFFLAAQTLLQLFDLGMTPTINREVARCAALGQIAEAGRLLHSFAVIGITLAIIFGLLAILLSPLIAGSWLISSQLPQQNVQNAVALMSCVLALRWPISIYQGALIGAQRIVAASTITASMATLGAFGAIMVLMGISQTIEAFFIWQLLIAAIHLYLIRHCAWNGVGQHPAAGIDLKYIKQVMSFSIGAGAISIAGLLLSQLDKIILSKSVNLVDFGHYMLANTIASILYTGITPAFNVCYPKFSALHAQNKTAQLLCEYGVATTLLASIVFPAATIVIFAIRPLLEAWLGSQAIASDVAPLVSILIIAYALHGVMFIPYALMLAQGQTRSVFFTYLMLIGLSAPITVYLIHAHGVLGGALAQAALFTAYFIIGTYVTHRSIFPAYVWIWVHRDVGRPAAISATCGLVLWGLQSDAGDRSLMVVIPTAILVFIIMTTLCIFSTSASRDAMLRLFQSIRSS